MSLGRIWTGHSISATGVVASCGTLVKGVRFEAGWIAPQLRRRRGLLVGGREGIETDLRGAREKLADAQRDLIDVERMVEVLRTAFDLYDRKNLEERRKMLHSLIDHIVVGPTGGTIILKTDLADIEGLVPESAAGEKRFALGEPKRVPWVSRRGIQMEEQEPVWDHRQTVTRLLANLNQSPTMALAFGILPEATFAQRLKKLRIARGLTQKQLSRAAGLSKDLVYRWENELWGARRRSVERVAAVLGVSTAYLTDGSTVAKPTRPRGRVEPSLHTPPPCPPSVLRAAN